MTDLIAAAETAVNPYLVWIKLGALALAVVGLLGAGFYAGKRWDQNTITQMQLADQKAASKAQTLKATVQTKEATVVTAAAVDEGQEQAVIVTKETSLAKEIPNVIPSTVACIPVGFVRLLNGAALGSDTPDASFAPGEPDDACAPVSWRSVAADIADDYATANANARQLNDLEATIVALHAAYTATEGAKP